MYGQASAPEKVACSVTPSRRALAASDLDGCARKSSWALVTCVKTLDEVDRHVWPGPDPCADAARIRAELLGEWEALLERMRAVPT